MTESRSQGRRGLDRPGVLGAPPRCACPHRGLGAAPRSWQWGWGRRVGPGAGLGGPGEPGAWGDGSGLPAPMSSHWQGCGCNMGVQGVGCGVWDGGAEVGGMQGVGWRMGGAQDAGCGMGVQGCGMEDEGCIGCRVWDGGCGVWDGGWGGAQDAGCKAQSVGCSPRAARPQAGGVLGCRLHRGEAGGWRGVGCGDHPSPAQLLPARGESRWSSGSAPRRGSLAPVAIPRLRSPSGPSKATAPGLVSLRSVSQIRSPARKEAPAGHADSRALIFPPALAAPGHISAPRPCTDPFHAAVCSCPDPGSGVEAFFSLLAGGDAALQAHSHNLQGFLHHQAGNPPYSGFSCRGGRAEGDR